MRSGKIYRAALVMLLVAAGWGAQSRGVLAQDGPPRVKTDEAAGLEVQLHLIIARKVSDGEEEKLPASLDAVVKQLKTTFTFKSYRLATTMLNRVKNGGRLSVRWTGNPLLGQMHAPGSNPGSNDFNIQQVKLEKDDAGRDVVQMANFTFTARVTVPMPAVASAGAPTYQYEQTGITTDLSVREGEPTIVGTLNVGPSGDALIIVVTAKRPGK
ncbi:MAG TPA: hypothetical protein VGC87_02585 [Pyrinomonadaceae bacterium]|jgi:hypothetical protein